jgi:hypothetical protein
MITTILPHMARTLIFKFSCSQPQLPASYKLIQFYPTPPNSPFVEFTNYTPQPVYDWIAKNNGATAGLVDTVIPTFYGMFITHKNQRNLF